MAMSTTRKVVLTISGIVLGFILIVFIGMAILVSALRGEQPSIKDNSVLALHVSGPLPDYVPENTLNRLFGNPPQSLSSLLAQFRKAKADKRIKAIILDVDASETGWAKAEEMRGAITDVRAAGKPVYAYMEAGWAKAEEIRGAITDFRAAGKPVYAYMETGFNKDYYVAAACDKIYISPSGA